MAKVHRVLKGNLPPSGELGDFYLTDDGNIYIVDNDGTLNLMYSGSITDISSDGSNINIKKVDGSSTAIPIPKGPKGDQGEQGPTGPTGPAGPKGADGLTTSISLNSRTYQQSGGVIELPGLVRSSSGFASNLTVDNLTIEKEGGIGGTMSVNMACTDFGELDITVEDAAKVYINGHSVYHTGNNPSASTIGALPLSGGTLKGQLTSWTPSDANKAGFTASTKDDNNGNGDGQTHIGFKDSSGNYNHYFRGKGICNINTHGGVAVTGLIKGYKGMELDDSIMVGLYEDKWKAIAFRRKTSSRDYMAKFGVSYINGKLSSSSGTELLYGGVIEAHNTSSVDARYVFSNKAFVPESDNNKYLGCSTNRWQSAYCTEGKFYTSTRSYKTNINYLDDNKVIMPTATTYEDKSYMKTPKQCIIDAIKETPLVVYNYKSRMKNKSRNVADNQMFVGFIADDLYKDHQQFFNMIGERGINERENEKGQLVEEVQYDISDISMLGVLWAGLQEALKENDKLKEEIELIKNKISL